MYKRQGSHKPEATDKRQPSLSAFNGKSVKGVWQLIVRNTRSDRFGVLHNWALYVKRQEPKPAETSTPPAKEPQSGEAPPPGAQGKTDESSRREEARRRFFLRMEQKKKEKASEASTKEAPQRRPDSDRRRSGRK